MTTSGVTWRRRLGWLAIAVTALFLSATPLAAPATTTGAVVVGNPGTQHYAEFDGVSLQMTAGGGTGVFTWSASGLPNSLNINTSTGLISGWARAGNWTVTVTATDTAGVSGSTTFLIQVPRECRTC